MEKKRVAILMGSDSDLPTLKPAIETLESFGISCTVRILTAHRTPGPAAEFALSARENGYGVIIAAAGKAAHLAGAMAAHSTLPIIGVPIGSVTLGGLDALLSIVQMPPGVPVATVAIDGAVNAALLAVRILSVNDVELADKLDEYVKNLEAGVLAKDKAVQEQLGG